MIEDLRRRVASAVQQAVQAVTGEHIELPSVESPPRPEFGDLAVPAALELGRRLERQPRQLAEELLAWLASNPAEGISRWQIAGPGYLNAFFDRGYVLDLCLQQVPSGERPVRFDPTPVSGQKTHATSAGADSSDEPPGTFISTSAFHQKKPLQIVEHTSINPNKAAHIGHLRNACLGDTLAPGAAFPGRARGSAKLHRRYRRPGGRRCARLHRPSKPRCGRRRRASGTLRLHLLGPCMSR